MIRLIFRTGGGAVVEALGRSGERLLDAAQRADQPLEGTCGGDMACGTCLVTIAPADAARLPPPSEEEEDLLDLLPKASRHSRLACQLRLTATLDGLAIELPGNRRRR